MVSRADGRSGALDQITDRCCAIYVGILICEFDSISVSMNDLYALTISLHSSETITRQAGRNPPISRSGAHDAKFFRRMRDGNEQRGVAHGAVRKYSGTSFISRKAA